MEKDGVVHIKGNSIMLTANGERLAEAIVRRHRLAERLLSEVLEIDEGAIEENACSFEHTLSPIVTDSMCTLLGHPPTCPHGLPIPRGACCRRSKDELKPIVQQLTVLDVGERGRIIFIASNSHMRLDKLGKPGIFPA